MSQNIFSRMDFTVKAGESKKKKWSSAYGMWYVVEKNEEVHNAICLRSQRYQRPEYSGELLFFGPCWKTGGSRFCC